MSTLKVGWLSLCSCCLRLMGLTGCTKICVCRKPIRHKQQLQRTITNSAAELAVGLRSLCKTLAAGVYALSAAARSRTGMRASREKLFEDLQTTSTCAAAPCCNPCCCGGTGDGRLVTEFAEPLRGPCAHARYKQRKMAFGASEQRRARSAAVTASSSSAIVLQYGQRTTSPGC